MATSDIPEVVVSIIPQECSEPIHFPCDLKLLDHPITESYLKHIHQCLSKVAIHWYAIGIYLGIPKSKLDIIEGNYSDISRRLMEMICTWIRNSKDCTWRALSIALRDCGYIESANSVRHLALEVAFDSENLPSSQANDWEEQKAMMEKEVDLLKQDLRKEKASYKESMNCIREKLAVPSADTDQLFLSQFEQYIFSAIFLLRGITFASDISNITVFFRNIKLCLQKWAELLLTNVTEVCNKLKKLTKQKNDLRDTIFKLEPKTMQPFKQNGQEKIEKSAIQAKEIILSLHHADFYCEFLRHELHTCLDHVDAAIKSNENLKYAVLSTVKSYRGMFITSQFLFQVTFVLFRCLYNSFCFGFILGAMTTTLLVLFIIKLRRACIIKLACLLGGASLACLLLWLQLDDLKQSRKPQINLDDTKIIQFLLSFVSGFTVGSTLRTLVLSFICGNRDSFNLVAFIFFVLAIYTWKNQVTNNWYALGAVMVGICMPLVSRNFYYEAVAMALIGHLLLFLITTVIIIIVCRFTYNGWLGTSLVAAAGAIMGLLYLEFFTSIKFPMSTIERKMNQYLQCFSENTEELKQFREDIKRALHDSQSEFSSSS